MRGAWRLITPSTWSKCQGGALWVRFPSSWDCNCLQSLERLSYSIICIAIWLQWKFFEKPSLPVRHTRTESTSPGLSHYTLRVTKILLSNTKRFYSSKREPLGLPDWENKYFACQVKCNVFHYTEATRRIASYADILWARHAIFLPDCMTSPKNVCVGGYSEKGLPICIFHLLQSMPWENVHGIIW